VICNNNNNNNNNNTPSLYYKIYNTSDFTDKDDDLDAAFVCIMLYQSQNFAEFVGLCSTIRMLYET